MNAPPRPRCIVVGVDDTGTRHDTVLTAALDQASWSNAELRLVHVLAAGPPEPHGPNDAETRRRRLAARPARIRTMTAELSQHLAEHLPEGRITAAVRFDVRYGDPGTVLLAAARQADLIVIGTRHPASSRSPFLLGAVSQDVALNAACPVLLVPRNGEHHPGARDQIVQTRLRVALRTVAVIAYGSSGKGQCSRWEHSGRNRRDLRP